EKASRREHPFERRRHRHADARAEIRVERVDGALRIGDAPELDAVGEPPWHLPKRLVVDKANGGRDGRHPRVGVAEARTFDRRPPPVRWCIRAEEIASRSIPWMTR